MRKAARAIVIHDGKLLVMHRNKFGTEYDTLPGGNVEIGETPEQTALREVAEEATIEVQNPRLVFIEHAGDMYGDQYVYLCDYIQGEPVLAPGSEEDEINKMGKNLYQPMWVSLENLSAATFLSEELKVAILDASTSGWPQTPKEFASTRTI